MAGSLIYPAARKQFQCLRSKLYFLNVPRMSQSEARGQFPDTQWSLVMRLQSPDSREARRATEEVFSTYRYPLYGFLRRDGMGHEDAEDVLQGFFEKMLRTDSLGDADRARGKLRTFLLTALSRFKLNWQRGERRRHQRVQAEADLWDADEARWQSERHATQETPEHFFDRRWAAELIEHARLHLRQVYEARGKQDLHLALSPLLSSSEPELESFPAIAERLNLTENALRVALHRLRKDFSDLLLREVKGTLDENEDARAEIQHLLTLFER
jgi:RNA polymerase sigma-70 factor (ECF subfamily)